MLEKLAKQTAIYGISTIIGKMMSYLLTPFYTRIFTEGKYGIITDAYALIPFALVLLSLGMESGYFRFAAKAEAEGGDVNKAKQKLFSSTWAITALAAITFFVVILFFQNQVAALMGEVYIEHPAYVITIAAIILFDVISAVPFARLREEGRAGTFVLLRLLNIMMQVAFAFIFWGCGLMDGEYGVQWAFIANLLASAITAVILVIICRTIPKISWSIIAAVAIYSMPLLISGIAGTAGELLDRQLIKYLLPVNSMSELGLYGAITKLAVVMTLFTQMYRLAAEPFFLSNFSKDNFIESAAEAMKYFILASIIIFLGIVLYSDLFALIIGHEFRKGMHILPIVLLGNVLSGVWLNLSFWYKREEKTKYALYITLIGVGCSLLFGYLFIPRLGYTGAAYSRLMAEISMVIVSLTLTKIYYPTPYEWKKILKYVLVGALIYILSFSYANLNIIFRYAISTTLMLAFLFYVARAEKIDTKGLVKSILHRR
ncbi:MAG: polysaccharide biosynthesis protein [Alistipes sp.]|nr:polysaccharide biosynthesis protein [Candidatus Alistipes equi]